MASSFEDAVVAFVAVLTGVPLPLAGALGAVEGAPESDVVLQDARARSERSRQRRIIMPAI
jgi:hypothetical protein